MPEAVRLDFEKLIDYVKDNFSDKDREMLQKAFELAYNAHEGQKRRSGEPYIIHPLAVAKILAEMGMDAESVCAALLHDVVEDTEITSQEVRNMFGSDVEHLVDGVTKLGQIPLSASKEEAQSENIRKMFLV